MRPAIAEQADRIGHGMSATVGLIEACRKFTRVHAHGTELRPIARGCRVPYAQRDVGNGEVLPQVKMASREQPRDVAGPKQGDAETVHLFTDSIVFFTKLDDLAQL